jgi:hypothetical protein
MPLTGSAVVVKLTVLLAVLTGELACAALAAPSAAETKAITTAAPSARLRRVRGLRVLDIRVSCEKYSANAQVGEVHPLI